MFRRVQGQPNVPAPIEAQNGLAEDFGGLPPVAGLTVTFERGTEFTAYPALRPRLEWTPASHYRPAPLADVAEVCCWATQ